MTITFTWLLYDFLILVVCHDFRLSVIAMKMSVGLLCVISAFVQSLMYGIQESHAVAEKLHDAVVKFDKYLNFQRHHAVLPRLSCSLNAASFLRHCESVQGIIVQKIQSWGRTCAFFSAKSAIFLVFTKIGSPTAIL